MNMYPDKDQPERLKAGLAKMRPDFLARLCGCCGGAGQYQQTFNAGCGAGYYRAMGMCDYCQGDGLVQGDEARPAARSVVEQVMNAGAQEAQSGSLDP